MHVTPETVLKKVIELEQLQYEQTQKHSSVNVGLIAIMMEAKLACVYEQLAKLVLTGQILLHDDKTCNSVSLPDKY